MVQEKAECGLSDHGKERAMNTKKHIMWRNGPWLFLFAIALCGVLVLFQAVPVLADDKQESTQLVEKACTTFDNFMHDKDMTAFRSLLRDAKAVVIVPSLLKGALIVGGSGGNAVGMVRDQRTGQWSEPAFYTIGGASLGLQIGGRSSEVILVAMTDRGANALLGNNFKLGGDVGVVAGPVGWGTQAALANLSADIISFSRSEKGLYGGISLDGALVAVRGALNDAYYGKKVSPADILVRHEVANPRSACLAQGLAQS
jgi:lipid-binding SYLF domain-containing protein